MLSKSWSVNRAELNASSAGPWNGASRSNARLSVPCCRRSRQLNWFLGLLIYGTGGTGLGTMALAYISLALTSSIFSSTIVFNAIIARVWLGERMGKADGICYLVIIFGVTLTAVFIPKEMTAYDVQQVVDLWVSRNGIIYWAILLSTLVSLHRTPLFHPFRPVALIQIWHSQSVVQLVSGEPILTNPAQCASSATWSAVARSPTGGTFTITPMLTRERTGWRWQPTRRRLAHWRA